LVSVVRAFWTAFNLHNTRSLWVDSSSINEFVSYACGLSRDDRKYLLALFLLSVGAFGTREINKFSRGILIRERISYFTPSSDIDLLD
jgi:hypothetical protein